ncbi:GMC family oxidoreductase [Chloroflexi bacterium TSY]|nr:GMC family oxidoreductase [Chloroflexi bacterium TSY]
MDVNPFGGIGDDLYDEDGSELRVPKAFVNMTETPSDQAVRHAQTEAAFDLIAALAGATREEAHNRTQFGGDPNRKVRLVHGNEDGSGTTYHECGTLWMGDDPSTSVTDVNGRFHHVTNAYCVDQALFPTAGSANPVPTGLALSRKIARSIVERYRSASISAPVPGRQMLFDGTLQNWTIAGAPNSPFTQHGDSGGWTSGVTALGILWFSVQTFRNFTLTLEWKAFYYTQ